MYQEECVSLAAMGNFSRNLGNRINIMPEPRNNFLSISTRAELCLRTPRSTVSSVANVVYRGISRNLVSGSRHAQYQKHASKPVQRFESRVGGVVIIACRCEMKLRECLEGCCSRANVEPPFPPPIELASVKLVSETCVCNFEEA